MQEEDNTLIETEASVQYIFLDTQITEAVAIVQASGDSVIRISWIYQKHGWWG